MENKSILPILQDPGPSRRSLNRREWIARILGGVTSGIAFPGLAVSHPVRELLADSTITDLADARVAAADWNPEFLDSFQVRTFSALAERIIPGSSHAQVTRFVDTLLSAIKTENQERFLNSLAEFESESMKKFGLSYQDLTETQQDEILTTASMMESGHPRVAGRRRRRMSLGPPPPGSAQDHDTMRDHFENIKGWVTGAYYSSEVGMRELGWTGEVMFESYPGCEHPGGHA